MEKALGQPKRIIGWVVIAETAHFGKNELDVVAKIM